ncbi:MAG: hypothetical protein Kow0074_24240 [Candidatus Zixiibacteriota bacterium]
MSRESFLQDMQQAIQRPVRQSGGHPNTNDLLEYFRTLRNNPNAALAAYREYAGSFMIHIESATRGRQIDVAWPGGSCDRWSEILSRPQRQHRRMIDCEGYAYLAQQLLTAAGWDFIGFEIIYLPTQQTEPEDYHIMAVLESPGEPPRRVYIGSDRISDSWFDEARSVWPGEYQNAETVGPAPTVEDGIDRVMRRVESGAAREIAPLSGRRSFSPPSFGD